MFKRFEVEFSYFLDHRCAEVESDTDFKNWNRGHDMLRNSENEVILKRLPEYLDEHQVALEAFDYINRGSDSKFKGQMVQYHIGDIMHDPLSNITTIDVKVEYGFTLCLKFPNRKIDDRICPVDVERDNYVCEVTVISDPNLTTNLKVEPGDSDDIACEKKKAVDEELVVPVKAVCMGCPQPVSLNDPSILRVAEFAVIEYDKISDERELHTIRRLHKAHTQVVNGIKYYLTLELGETDCKKPLSAFNMNRSLCNENFTEEPEICEVVVLEQPWQKSSELVSSKCFDKSEYSTVARDEFIVPVVGSSLQSSSSGISNPSDSVDYETFNHETPVIDLESNLWKKSIDFVVQEFNRREVDDNDDGFYKIINVLDATTTNDLEGEVDHLVIELAETICTRRRTMAECPLKLDEDTEICEASVLRGDPDQLLSLRCDEKDEDDIYILAKNPFVSPYQPLHEPFFVAETLVLGAPGGPIEQPTNETSIVDVARFVVHQYNLQSDEDELYTLSRIIRSYSQLSSNVIYTLEIELRETQCKKYQPVDDVTKCPLEPREESEVCQAEVSVSIDDTGVEHKSLTKIFCDDRKDYYVKMMKHLTEVNHQAPPGNWKPEEKETDKMRELGELVADEFDFRSDEDNIFVFSKILDAKTEETGLTHRLKVELAETVCPKYKPTINKSRCAIDIGEEAKICDAVVTEQPWKGQEKVVKLSCFERDDSLEEDESKEVLYPNVHPSAHARPRFLQSRFRARFSSHESDESNEKYYYPRVSRMRHDVDSDEDVKDEPDSKPSLLGSFNAVDVNDSKVQELSSYALAHMDSLSDDQHLRRVEQVLEAHRKVVAGLLWVIKSKVVYTNCPKETQNSTDLTECETDTSKPTYICHLEIYERPWEKFRTVQESRCESEASPTRQRRSSDAQTKHTLGSAKTVDVNNPRVQELSTFALNHMDQVSEDGNLRKVDEILEATKQIVSGVKWSLKIRVVSTVCPKDSGSSADMTACEVDTSKPSSICVVKIWEQAWLNSTSVTEAHCEPESTPSNRNRRFAAGNIESRPGSAKPVDVNDPRVQKLSSFALNHMDQVSEDSNLRKVDEILEATKQIVSGVQWSLKIRVVSTVCSKDSGSSADMTACEVDTSKPSSICVVKIWEQTWLNSTSVTEAHCEPESMPSNRNRRFASGNIESRPGSAKTVDVNDPRVQKLSIFALNHMDQVSEDSNLRKVDEILEATKQIVRGNLWSLKIRVVSTVCTKDSGSSADATACEVDTSKPSSICVVKIWEVVWENSTTVTEAHCDPESTPSNRNRRFAAGNIESRPGSAKTVDIVRGNLWSLKIRVVSTVVAGFLWSLKIRVIVRGNLWSLKLRVVSTVCTKDSGSSADVTACEVDTSKPSSICVVKIWEVVWENSTTVTEAHCEPESAPSNRNRRFAAGNIESRPGSAKTVDVNNPRVQELSIFALNHLDQVSEDGNLRKVDEILEATKQIVSGVQWSLKIRVVSTVCPKDSGSSTDMTACEVDTSKPSSICVVKIWEQAWLNSTSVTEAHCEPESTPSNRNRRFAAGNIESRPGSAKTVDVNDHRVQKLSIFALNHMDQVSEDSNLRKVDEVLEATKQIVRGNLWSLKIRVVSTVCTKDSGSSADMTACEVDTSKPSSICVVKIWEVVWENSTTVTEAHCEPESTPSNRNRRFAAGETNSKPGSATPIDVNDPKVQELSTFALNHMDQVSEDSNLRKVDEILEASRQSP
ncbi:Cystatin [Armadillidium nasatum]|uniref:Cystatin n=1 Tax=Armadillidium nasatum TaxID=96803 RepID=A0A5N5TJS2_9CRUS|nr:Cystatin [Armadillidium nasatum]